MKFPCEEYPSGEKSVFFPTLKTTIINSKTKEVFPNLKVLVDSGASSCVFSAVIGESIGIDVTSGKQLTLSGVTKGAGKQFLHTVTLVIGGHDIEVEAGFSYDFLYPFGLLGQEGFFEKFRICFDLPKKSFEMVPKRAEG